MSDLLEKWWETLDLNQKSREGSRLQRDGLAVHPISHKTGSLEGFPNSHVTIETPALAAVRTTEILPV